MESRRELGSLMADRGAAQGGGDQSAGAGHGTVKAGHVLPIPAHTHGIGEFVINGQKVDATYLQGAAVPLNVTGLPGISMRFGTSRDGMPINVRLVGSWPAESTILHGIADGERERRAQSAPAHRLKR